MQSVFADWLNQTFFAFDQSILSFYHNLALVCGGILTPLMRAMTFIGEKGILMFALAFLLMLFAKTRKSGVCIFGAVCCGALITNILLKGTVCRLRPFELYEEFTEFWQFVGVPAESGYSFPSGHVTAAAAGMTALWLSLGKKYLSLAIPYVSLMAISRNYLMAHYPTDVIAAALIGILSAVIAFFITKGIYFVLTSYEKVKFFAFLLNFDIKNAIIQIHKKKEHQ